MATATQPEKLDDIQLALYLAQTNNQGQPLTYIITQADRFLDWINEKRRRQAEDNRENIYERLKFE